MRNLMNQFVFVTCVSVLSHIAQADQKPNIVMIMTDNHGAWTLGCYGNKDIRTPNIDRLAQEGTLFDNAFASNPVCSPTRASVLTGLIPSQHGVHCFLRGGRLQTGADARCTLTGFASLPKELNKAGYSCGLVGKWHLGGNMTPQEGFDDYWVTTPHGGTSTFYGAQVIENGKLKTEPQYLTDFWTGHAVKFIEQRAVQTEQPFFLLLTYNGPYALSRLLLREGQNRHADFYRDKELISFPREAPHPWQLHNRDYQNNPVSISRVATEVSGVDDGVGAVMDALKTNGFDDNTLVIFLADQGWVGGHGGFFGMGDHTRPTTAVDGMMKIPMIWRHPNQIAAGQRSQKLVANYDIMPTILEHVNLPTPWGQTNQSALTSPGKSFGSELQSAAQGTTDDEAIFYEFETLRCIRTARWKYTHRFPNGPHELYDLTQDPTEFNNVYQATEPSVIQQALRSRMDAFFATHASPKYDLYNGGGSQTVIYDGIEEEIAQLIHTPPPALTEGFVPQEFSLPEGFSAELVAGPPLVQHPTMGCFDDVGRLFMCDNAGVNMSAEELESELPNRIRMLEDQDGDGTFDKSTIFADKMTFPMGAAWHDGALYVASPPNIWRLQDTNNDGVADKREVIVDKFGYSGNAASIHGCFFSPDGRLYWCDGYHGHDLKNVDGRPISKRKGSYIFSSRTDGSDLRIHCGGGMDNPVEVEFTEEGDVIGTVNILYTRPRADCLVHWQYGGAYPHREAFLEEWPVTGDLLEPIHRFGHVAISGMLRYRSGVMNHEWGNNVFATEFNLGKVVRLELNARGSTFSVTEREFLSCSNRDFHPTDVIEDADGSLLVVDTGGWFYRGCPTSQSAKPDVLGGIYRVRRDGMTTVPDPRGNRIDWPGRSISQLLQDLKDTRFAVREKAIQECVRRGESLVNPLVSTAKSADLFARRNAVWALTRIIASERQTDGAPQDHSQPQSHVLAAMGAIRTAVTDRDASIRQAACHALSTNRDPKAMTVLAQAATNDSSAAVRRTALEAIGRNSEGMTMAWLYTLLDPQKTKHKMDREERHALSFAALSTVAIPGEMPFSETGPLSVQRITQSAEDLVVLDQVFVDGVSINHLQRCLEDGDSGLLRAAIRIIKNRVAAGKISTAAAAVLDRAAVARAQQLIATLHTNESTTSLLTLLNAFEDSAAISEEIAAVLTSETTSDTKRQLLLTAVATSVRSDEQMLRNAVQTLMSSHVPAVRAAAIEASGAVDPEYFLPQLSVLANAADEDPLIRLAALNVQAKQPSSWKERKFFTQLVAMVSDGTAQERATATQLLGSGILDAEQLAVVASLLQECGPQQLSDLVPLFKRSLKPDLADAFLSAIESARSLNSLPMLEVSEVVKRFPPELHDRANSVLNRMNAAEQQKRKQLDQLVGILKTGDSARGQTVFFSEKAKCASCHVAADKGKRVGPDLSTIGANRVPHDLLESIVFPSATLVRQYEPYNLLTNSGRTYSGLVIRDTKESVTILQSTGEPVTVSRRDVEEFVPSRVSVMPKGLDEALTPQQIVDIVAWLQTLR